MHRLEEATGRLERAVEARLGENRGANDARPGDDEVERALAEARAENARLREANNDIAARLDAAIARLKDVLER